MDETVKAQIKSGPRQMQEYVRHLEQANQELEFFARQASHDLRSPLNTMRSYLGLLKSSEDPAERTQLVDVLERNTIRLSNLIDDLLVLSQVDRGEWGREWFDLGAALVELADDIGQQHPEARIQLQNVTWIHGHPSQLRMAFQNLIENAIKYRRKETPQIVIQQTDRGHEWRFDVADNGMGIESDHHETIFQPFRRLHSADRLPGTGLGLAICRKIISRHGGQIGLFSRPGEGSTFFFSIPKPG